MRRKLFIALLLTSLGTTLVSYGSPSHTIIDAKPPHIKIETLQTTVDPKQELTPIEPATTQPEAPVEVRQPEPYTGPCGDNQYAHEIYMQESGCILDRVNSIGACGIGQSLPCSKMANDCPNWRTDYACQNAWFTAYAMSYGSWEQAYSFKFCRWVCYSTRTKTTVNKNGEPWW